MGSNGSIVMDYALGGVPTILVPDAALAGSGLCGHALAAAPSDKAQAADSAGAPLAVPLGFAFGALSAVAALVL